MLTRTSLSIAAFAIVAAISARAEAKHVRYLGPHPVAAKQGGGYCYIEAPHLHVYGPDRPALYQQSGDEYVFTGDPTPFGYEGEKHPYYGHHAVVVAGAPEPVYCLLDGPHFHPYEAPATAEFKIKDGVAFYVAPIPQVYVKPARVKVVNAEYRPYVSFRPTVEVAPPPEWRGEVYVAGPSVEVRAPGVFIEPPRPHVSVEVSAPGVFIAPPQPHVVVAAPAPHVYVSAPAPHVFVPAPPVMGVRVEHEERWEHHDNGRHEGWGGGEHHDNGRHEGWGKHGGGHH